MQKKKIAVIFGGNSTEYEVSLQSAHAVLENMDTDSYEVLPIGITREGDWYHYLGDLGAIAENTWHKDADKLRKILFSPSRSENGFVEICEGEETPIRVDLVFPVLHGKNGEDGTLQGMFELAFAHDTEVIVEENVCGFEVGCAVMGMDELTVGRVDEIELEQGFFDYTEKYTLKTSKIYMPARIDEVTEKRIQRAAVAIYRALGCSGFARVDMFYTPEGEIVFNEVNTIPGFTSHSRYPNMMKGIGLSFEEMLKRLISLYIK